MAWVLVWRGWQEAEEEKMSQRGVERVIGRLVTDEEFRRQFAEDPRKVLLEVIGCGCGLELTNLEIQALASLDLRSLARLAESIDPRIQKICVEGLKP
jgi:hypothetical protein